MFVKYHLYVPHNLYYFALLFIRLRTFSVPSLLQGFRKIQDALDGVGHANVFLNVLTQQGVQIGL